jgi:3-oxoacyl-[acyl-carrier-protein] synthase II
MTAHVVITGWGCVSPLGVGRAAFEAGILAGRSGIRRMTRLAGLPCEIAAPADAFDPTGWVDAPVSRAVPMALAATAEALEMADLTPPLPKPLAQRVGVMLGSGGGAIELTERLYGQYFAQGGRYARATAYAIPNGTAGSLSSEISLRFGLRGLSHVVTTGCTSGTDAIGLARLLIQTGVLDAVVCGGVDAPITRGVVNGFCRMKVVTPSWNQQPTAGSRPFAQDHDGFVLGEGAWLFVLENAEHASARGVRAIAAVAAYGAACDTHHRVRLDETGEEPIRVIQHLLKEAGRPPIDYIHLHGTATPLNDRVEAHIIRQAFGPTPPPASATKSMIGHAQGASGPAGVAAILTAMSHQRLPPTLNLSPQDPHLDLDLIPTPGRHHPVHWALCHCLGFGSKSNSLLLESLQ